MVGGKRKIVSWCRAFEKNPEAISAVASPPPKKDMGQSPMHVTVNVRRQ